jgi:two-component system sensor histidine kinase QseC
LKLIDRQISESSSTLLSSEAFRKSVHSPKDVEETISKVLQGTRIGKVFVLRDKNAKILYQSFNVGLLNAELPIHPEWVTVETPTEYTRLRNIPLPKSGDLILQVGLVLDRNFLNWEIVDLRLINYVSGIVVAIFLASVILTLILLSPLRQLIGHLGDATSNMENLKDLKGLPVGLTKYRQGFWAKSDEFSSLLSTVQKLIERINLNYKLTRSWTLQMTHELKTPLAILRAQTEGQRKGGHLPAEYSKSVLEEVDQMSEIVGQFLDWAELENSVAQKNLHALRIGSAVKTVASRLEKLGNGRIHLSIQSDFQVFANPVHLDQLIANLVTNSIKFSPLGKDVEIVVKDHMFSVADSGPGIPSEVQERLGQPFNVGTSETPDSIGNGLGLAWVSTVAKLYNWKVDIQSSSSGARVSIYFPNEIQI